MSAHKKSASWVFLKWVKSNERRGKQERALTLARSGPKSTIVIDQLADPLSTWFVAYNVCWCPQQSKSFSVVNYTCTWKVFTCWGKFKGKWIFRGGAYQYLTLSFCPSVTVSYFWQLPSIHCCHRDIMNLIGFYVHHIHASFKCKFYLLSVITTSAFF